MKLGKNETCSTTSENMRNAVWAAKIREKQCQRKIRNFGWKYKQSSEVWNAVKQCGLMNNNCTIYCAIDRCLVRQQPSAAESITSARMLQNTNFDIVSRANLYSDIWIFLFYFLCSHCVSPMYPNITSFYPSLYFVPRWIPTPSLACDHVASQSLSWSHSGRINLSHALHLVLLLRWISSHRLRLHRILIALRGPSSSPV